MNLINTLQLWWLIPASTPAPPSAGGGGSAPDPMQITSIFDFVIKGGWAMVPIGLCSLMALTIIVERSLMVRRRRVVPPRFVAELKAAAGDRQRTTEACQRHPSPIASVIAVGQRRPTDSIDRREKMMEEAALREVVSLRRYMRVLSSLPQVATMLGLLGTVFGMIKTFQSVAAMGESLGKTEALAEGIYEAWAATAAGLVVAVPVLIAYHFLMGKIDARVAEMDVVMEDWMEQTLDHSAAASSLSPSVNGRTLGVVVEQAASPAQVSA